MGEMHTPPHPTPRQLLETRNFGWRAPSIPGGRFPEEEGQLRDGRDAGGAALTMVSPGGGSHVESG